MEGKVTVASPLLLLYSIGGLCIRHCPPLYPTSPHSAGRLTRSGVSLPDHAPHSKSERWVLHVVSNHLIGYPYH